MKQKHRRTSKALLTRPISATTPDKRARNDSIGKALSALEREIGGREALHALLSCGEPDEAEERLVLLLADPEYKRLGLTNICSMAGFSVSKLLRFLAKAGGAKAHVLSLRKIQEGLPEVAGAVVDAAKDRTGICRSCGGTGNASVVGAESPKDHVCFTCNGLGSVTERGDLERQKMTLQMGGLLKTDKAGAVVNVNQQVAIAQGRDNLKEFLEATDRILYGQIRTIDAQEAEEEKGE